MRFVDSMSINAAMFASVVLASRLATNIQVFALTCCAVQLFALLPLLRRVVKQGIPPLDVALTVCMVSLTIYAYKWHVYIVAVYLMLVVLTGLASPALLIYLQRYKLQISGPWDEGKPKILKQQSVLY